MLSNKETYMRELTRSQTLLLNEAGRGVKRAMRRLRGISLLLDAWRKQENLPACMAALGADEDAAPLDVAEAALSDFIFDVGEVTGNLHDWDRLEQIRAVGGGKEALVT